MSEFPWKCHFVWFWASMWETMELSPNSNDATFLQRKRALASPLVVKDPRTPNSFIQPEAEMIHRWVSVPAGRVACLCWTISPSVQPPGVPTLMWKAHQRTPTVPPQNWLTLLSWISTTNSSLWSFFYFLLFVQVLLCSQWISQTTQSTTTGHRTLSKIFGTETALASKAEAHIETTVSKWKWKFDIYHSADSRQYSKCANMNLYSLNYLHFIPTE